jgi:hypothetical protein
VNALQEKARGHKARAAQLASEVASLRAQLAETQSAWPAAAFARAPLPPGAAGAPTPTAAFGGALGGGALGGGTFGGSALLDSPSKSAAIAAALAAMRQRQEAYLAAL